MFSNYALYLYSQIMLYIYILLVTSDCSCENRCHKMGQVIQCCHSECAAGCTGGNTDQCQVEREREK